MFSNYRYPDTFVNFYVSGNEIFIQKRMVPLENFNEKGVVERI